MCSRCRRPTTVCYCAALPRIETRTRVVILQHPREREMPIGTARMASLCLANASLRVGLEWTADNLADVLGDRAAPPILLAPGPDARDILREPPAGQVTLVVIDGTWSQAKSLLRRNPVLQTLPRYAFVAPEPTQYRIRREPKPEYVSTIEALMHVLGVLEGDPLRVRALLDPFHAMVDAQLDCQARAPQRTSYRKPSGPKPVAPPRVPAGIATRFDDVVCVVGEANAWPYAHAGRDPCATGSPPGWECGSIDGSERKDEVVHWVAHRPSTGETFERVAAPRGALSPNTTFHTELTDEVLRSGVERTDLIAAFERFLRPNDVVCAWGHYAPDLLAASGGPRLANRIDLRAAAHRLTNKKIGSLEAYAETLASRPPPMALGRAGRRLAMIVQIVRAWRLAALAPRS